MCKFIKYITYKKLAVLSDNKVFSSTSVPVLILNAYRRTANCS